MERQMIKRIFVSGLVLGLSARAALAHPGDHALSALGSVAHLLTEPDHLAMLGIAVILVLGVWRWRQA
jgi:hydrogenase/urease accessory protein HupE